MTEIGPDGPLDDDPGGGYQNAGREVNSTQKPGKCPWLASPSTTFADTSGAPAMTGHNQRKYNDLRRVPRYPPPPLRRRQGMAATSTVKNPKATRRNVGEIILRGSIWWVRYYDLRGLRRFESSKSTHREEAEKLLRKRLTAKDCRPSARGDDPGG
jgi:hypothetical protein